MPENELDANRGENDRQLDDVLLRIHAGKMNVPLDQQMDYLRTQISSLTGRDKIAAEIMYGTVRETMERLASERQVRSRQRSDLPSRSPEKSLVFLKRITPYRVIAGLLILVGVAWFVLNRRLVSFERSPFELRSGYFGKGDTKNRVAVVFVHGVFGASQDTWQNGGTSFPGLLSGDPDLLGRVDVFLFEYYTPKFGTAASVVGLADQLRGTLDDYKVFDDHQEVIFLAHSMGGLVVRQFLLTKRDRLEKVPFLFFFATPTFGSELAEVARELSSNPQLRGMIPLEGNDLLQSIQSEWLGWNKAKMTPSYCAYETNPTEGVMVVSMSSATALCNQDLDPISANHIEIVKPTDRNDPRYMRFANILKKYIAVPSHSTLVKTGKRLPHPDDSDCVKWDAAQRCMKYKYAMTFDSIATDPAAKNWVQHPSNLPSNAKVNISWDGLVTSAEHPDDPSSVEIAVLVDSPNAPKNCALHENDACGGQHKPSGAWTRFHLEKEATSGPNGELDVVFSLNFCGGRSAHCSSNDGVLLVEVHK